MDNNMNTHGDGNFSLQNVTAGDITINVAESLPDEIKQKKQKLKKQLEMIAAKAQEKLEAQQTDEEKPAIAADRDTKLLMRAIQAGRCVLFLGPEIAIDEQGQSLHEQFYLRLSADELNELVYNTSEGFFQPHEDPMFEIDVNEYYTSEFLEQNQNGQKILEQLASIPFKLIVSLSPDDGMHNIYQQYDIDHEFLYYDGAAIADKKPETQKPVVLNVLGSAASNDGKFIFTYNDLYDYVKKAKIPAEIKKEIQNAAHFLFIGFDFNKWYNRLLMFVLGINDTDRNQARLLIENKKSADEIENFLKAQFKISIVEKDYFPFVENLAAYSDKLKIGRNLKIYLYKKQLVRMKKLAEQSTDADSMAELNRIEKSLMQIAQKLA